MKVELNEIVSFITTINKLPLVIKLKIFND